MFDIVNKGAKTVEILFYGYIEYWGQNSSKNLSVKLRDLDKENDHIIIRMNSGGGSVVEAVAIYETIKSVKAQVTIIIEGIAASAASFLLLAANRVEMGQASRIMIHKFSGGAWGNSDDLRDRANEMDDWETDWVKIYAKKMGLSAKAVKEKYFQRGKDTWIGAEEAIKLNLVDAVVDGLVEHDLNDIETTSIENVQRMYQNAITNQNSNSNIIMNEEQLKLIGLPANATEEQITARLNELKAAETAKPPVATDEPTPDPKVAELQARIDKMENAEVEKVINKAIDDKKIVAGDKPKWEAIAKNMDLETLKSTLENIPAASLPNDVIDPKNPNAPKADYKDYADLMSKGNEVVEKYKNENPEAFNELWKAEYGVDYTEDPNEK